MPDQDQNGLKLYLTPGEIEHLFRRLPHEIQEEWEPQLVEETLTSYESEDELRRRMENISFEDTPAMREYQKKVQELIDEGNDETFADALLDHFPEEELLYFYHTMGACGMEFMLEMALQNVDEVDSEIMEAVMAMSYLRHLMLEANAAHAT